MDVLSKQQANRNTVFFVVGGILSIVAICFYLVHKIDPEFIQAKYSGDVLINLAVLIFSLTFLKKVSKKGELPETMNLGEMMLYITAITAGLSFVWFSIQLIFLLF